MSNDIRVGDRFLVEVEVLAADEGGDAFDCTAVGGLTGATRMARDELLAAKRLPRAIKVGNKVIGPHGGHYTVLAIDGAEAWIKTSVGTRATAEIEDLTLVEPSP